MKGTVSKRFTGYALLLSIFFFSFQFKGGKLILSYIILYRHPPISIKQKNLQKLSFF